MSKILKEVIISNEEYAKNFNKKNKLDFINDPSNKDLNYTRVKLRNFLQNNKYKREIEKEFLNIKKQIKKSFRESAYYLSLKKLRKFYTKEGLPRH